jgi:adenosine/AMP kinase
MFKLINNGCCDNLNRDNFLRRAHMELISLKIEKPDDINVILGQSHFIKTVEDLHESMVNAVPGVKFGLAFCEASGPCLVRSSGTDGHCFIVFLGNSYPINVLNSIKNVPEVCTIFCATQNPVEVIIAESEGGRGILGVIDGFKSKGVETEVDIEDRKTLLRKIGYKA